MNQLHCVQMQQCSQIISSYDVSQSHWDSDFILRYYIRQPPHLQKKSRKRLYNEILVVHFSGTITQVWHIKIIYMQEAWIIVAKVSVLLSNGNYCKEHACEHRYFIIWPTLFILLLLHFLSIIPLVILKDCQICHIRSKSFWSLIYDEMKIWVAKMCEVFSYFVEFEKLSLLNRLFVYFSII